MTGGPMMAARGAEVARRQARRSAALLAAIAVLLAVMIHLSPQDLRVPAWVAYCAAATLMLMGIAMLCRAGGLLRNVFGLASAVGLLLPAVWLAFGEGPRECSASVPLLALSSETACRSAFTVAVIVGLLVLAWLVRHALRRPAPPGAGTSRHSEQPRTPERS